jgi:hypothetical protein
MNLVKSQIEIVELDDSLNWAYFYSEEKGVSFDVEFKLETTYHKPELEYKNGTGFNGEWEITFIDITYITFKYDEEGTPLGTLDVDKNDLESLISDYIIENELEEYYEQ